MVCHFLYFSLPVLCFWLFTPIFGRLYTTRATSIEQFSESLSREFAQPWPFLFSYPWLLPFHLRLHHLQCTQSSRIPFLSLQFQHLFFIFLSPSLLLDQSASNASFWKVANGHLLNLLVTVEIRISGG